MATEIWSFNFESSAIVNVDENERFTDLYGNLILYGAHRCLRLAEHVLFRFMVF